jgi:hypothetical protein
MYRIQAFNVKSNRIEIYIVHSMVDRDSKIKGLRSNVDYGLVTFEYNPRGAFYR